MIIEQFIRKCSKYLILIFYALAALTLVCYAWYKQNIINHSGSSPLYINLRKCPSYARKGFDPADLRRIPDETSGVWRRFESSTRRIVNSSLDLPKRSYLSPRGKEAQEFTIITLLETDSAAMAFLAGNNTAAPGIFFAGIGENWEVYFNGKLIISEMHTDETGRIMERRTWRDVFFPVDSSLVLPGTNILALRIVGDPTYRGTGLFYAAAPLYMEDYRVIDGRRFNFLNIALCGIFAYTGIYYVMLFFSIKRKKSELFNLYFGIFSILLCIYNVSVDGMFKLLVPNSDISIRLEYSSNILSILTLGMFFEALGRGKITKVTWGYMAFCFFICLTQILFCLQYGEEVIRIWDIITMIYVSYIFGYDIMYFHFWERHKGKAQGNKTQGLPIDSILIGMGLCYFCGLIDILDILFLGISIELFPYSIFAVHIGMAFTLSQRFSGMYKQLEQSNQLLETTVKERTLELEEQTAIAVQASRAKSEFLATMSHEIRTPLNAVIGLSEIELRNKMPDSSRENISRIHQSGVSLLGFINDILDISKIDDTAVGEETAEALRNFRSIAGGQTEKILPLQMRRAKILVVDDLPTNLLVARGLLAPYGLRVDTVASGREAIELVKNHKYDLIFMDQMMPEMDGIETLKAIRNNEQLRKNGRRVPIIALTANVLHGMKEFYLEKGFDDYLTKPISPEALDKIIKKWIREEGKGKREKGYGMREQLVSMNAKPANKTSLPSSLLPFTFYHEIAAQRLDILNHYLVSFTNVPETEWRAKFDTAYFERFTALIKSLSTAEMPAVLREQQDLLAEAGRKEDTRKIRETLPAFCGALQKWQEQEEKAADNEYNEGKMLDEILPRLKKALLAGETETAEAAIGELGETALTPAGRELYFRLYALMLEGNTEEIMEAIKELRHD